MGKKTKPKVKTHTLELTEYQLELVYEALAVHEAIGMVTDDYFYRKNIRIKKEELVTATNKPLNLTPLQQDSVKKYLSTLTTSFYETARWMLVNNK